MSAGNAPKIRTLGRTGFTVTEVGFGAWAIGGGSYGDVAERDAEAALEAYLAGGGNFVDTARNYRESERIIGSTLRRLDVRDGVVLTTKTGRTSTIEQASGIPADLEETLRLLQTDYVDVYYIHAPPEDPDVMRHVIDLFLELKRKGRIRAVGASIKGPDVTQATVDLCRQYVDTGDIDVIQLIYSIFRQRNAASIAYAHEHGVGIVARTVLENGFLTGKYRPGMTFDGADHRRRWSGRKLERLLREARSLSGLAGRTTHDTLAQVAIAFALALDGVSTTIPGAKSAKQATENLGVATLPPLPHSIVTELRTRYAGFGDIANTGD
jgi:aryl-alcohol dehydrogenase-like predicted oxidoreductase